jgi:MoxR-like ATPase
MKQLMIDMMVGEPSLLLGNQGVGKNKIVDRLLELLNMPRQYMQLHRDTTLQGLISVPSIMDGQISYQDSPLVVAAKLGHVVVIDEADKASVHITIMLRTLGKHNNVLVSS